MVIIEVMKRYFTWYIRKYEILPFNKAISREISSIEDSLH